MLRQQQEAFPLHMDKAPLSKCVWMSIFDCPDDVIAPVGGKACDAAYFPKHYQIRRNFIFVLVIAEPVIECGFPVLVSVHHDTSPVRKPCPVYQQVNSFPSGDSPFRHTLKLLREPPPQLPFAVPAFFRQCFKCPLSQYPFAEPDETVGTAHIRPSWGKHDFTILASVSLMTLPN